MTVTCFASYEFHPTNIGGCGVLLHHLANRLLTAGHEVVLLLYMPAEAVRQFNEKDRLTLSRPEGCRAYCVDELCDDLPIVASAVPCAFQWSAVRFAHAIARLQQREKIDYVEFFEYCGVGYYAFAQRLFAKTPSAGVLGSRLHGAIEWFDKVGAVKNTDHLVLHGLERRALELSEVVLSPSQTYYEGLARTLYKVEPERCVVSGPPKQDAGRVKSRPSAAGPFKIVFVGRMFHFKGVDQLVRAAVLLMEERPTLNFSVDLIGYDSDESPVPGSYTKYLRTLIPNHLQDRFVFTKFITHEEIAVRLEDALFGVFPNRVESFCYALHEVYDAGVPVIANDLAAFKDFFENERNAIIYDGTTPNLLAAMRRMIDDEALRTRLTRPYPVGDHPVGGYYDAPTQPTPLAPASPKGGVEETLVVVLCDGPDVSGCAAVASLQRQTLPASRIVCLVPAEPGEDGVLWLLGRPWHARTPDSKPVKVTDIVTTDALAVIEAGDILDPTWLEGCVRALSRRPAMAFAGTWPSQSGQTVPMNVDLTPELCAFDRRGELARVLVRTRPGILLADLFDPTLRMLGHLGYLWWATAQWGHGVLTHMPLIEIRPSKAAPPAVDAVRALLMRFGEPFGERLGVISGLLLGDSLRGEGSLSPLPQAAPTVEQKVALADELGGRTLARLAIKKLAKRVVSPAPPTPSNR